MDAFATPRLRATRIDERDLGDLVQLHLDPEVSRFLGGVRSPEQTATYLQTQCQHWARHGFGLWTLRAEDGDFVGRAGLRYVEVAGQEELEIAYTLRRAWWGQGLASEVASALVDIWRAELGQRSLVGLVEKGNVASDKVLLKAGFRYERDDQFHGLSVSLFRLTAS